MRYRTHGTRLTAALLVAIMALSVFAMPAVAAGHPGSVDEVEFEFEPNAVDDDTQDVEETFTLRLDDDSVASEGDEIWIDVLDADDGGDFELDSPSVDVSSASNIEDAAVELQDQDGELDSEDRIVVELTNVDDGTDLSGDEISVTVTIDAQEQAATKFDDYSEFDFLYVEADETGTFTDDEVTATVDIDEKAEYSFDADSIDAENPTGDEQDLTEELSIAFADGAEADQDDEIVVAVQDDFLELDDQHDTNFSLEATSQVYVSGENLDGVDPTLEDEGDILSGDDQVNITLNDLDGDDEVDIAGEVLTIDLEIRAGDGSEDNVKEFADEYDLNEFLAIEETVDDTGDSDSELELGELENDDEGIVLAEIQPGDVDDYDLEVEGESDETELGFSETADIDVENTVDSFDNTVSVADVEFTLDSNVGEGEYPSTTWEDADLEQSFTLGDNAFLQSVLGTFDLEAEVGEDDVEDDVEVTIYPDDVDVETQNDYNDQDLDSSSSTVVVDVDLGAGSDTNVDEIGAVIEMIDDDGGAIDFNADERSDFIDTPYEHDDILNQENKWVLDGDSENPIEDNEISYELEVEDEPGEDYEVNVEVMPYEGWFDDLGQLAAIDTAIEADDDDNEDTQGLAAHEDIADVSLEVTDDFDFIGTEADPEYVSVEVSDFEDDNGISISNTDDDVKIEIEGEEDETASLSAGDDSVSVDLNPAEIGADNVESREDAEIFASDIVGSQPSISTDLTMLHAVEEPATTGWTQSSLPQATELHLDVEDEDPTSLTQWDTENTTFDGFENAEGDSLELGENTLEDIHLGYYLYTEDEDARVGHYFATDEDDVNLGGANAELDEGWHLISSNYNIDDKDNEDLQADVNWDTSGFGSEDEAFAVYDTGFDRIHDETDGFSVDGSSEDIEPTQAYWVRIHDDDDAPLIRGVSDFEFDESSGLGS